MTVCPKSYFAEFFLLDSLQRVASNKKSNIAPNKQASNAHTHTHIHTSLRSLRDGFAKKLVGVHFDFHHYHYYQHPRLKDDHQSWLRWAGVLDFWSIAIHPPPIYRTDHLYKPALASLLRCYHRHCHHYQHCNNFWRCRHQHRQYHLRQ